MDSCDIDSPPYRLVARLSSTALAVTASSCILPSNSKAKIPRIRSRLLEFSILRLKRTLTEKGSWCRFLPGPKWIRTDSLFISWQRLGFLKGSPFVGWFMLYLNGRPRSIVRCIGRGGKYSACASPRCLRASSTTTLLATHLLRGILFHHPISR